MTWNIIFGSNDAYQHDELELGARAIAEQVRPRVPIEVKSVTSVENLERCRDSDTKLLIIAASLPRTGSSPEDQPGLSYVKSIGADANAPACIVVSDRIELFRIVQSIERCELLLVDCSTSYVEQCVQLAHRLAVISDRLPADSAASRQIAQPHNDAPPAMPLVATTRDGANAASAAVIPQRQEAALAPVAYGKRAYAFLQVDLPTDAHYGMVHLEINDSERVTRRSGPLRLDEGKLGELIKASVVLKNNLSKWQKEPQRYRRHYDRWHADYRSLGERVSRLLWGSQSFREYYYYGQGKADGNMRVRFNLQQPWFDGLWEAVSGEQDDRSLMLDNTIARRMFRPGEEWEQANRSGQIDTEDGTLNILVIKSNVHDGSVPKGPPDSFWKKYWESQKGTLSELTHMDEEIEVVEGLAKRNGAGKPLQVNVDILPRVTVRDGEAWSLADELESWLADDSRRYDIVHFAGHALFARGPLEDGRGYLVFSGHPQPEAVTISKIAPWLARAGVQLVYLSCCRSSAAAVALEFSRNKIPMALGFHWDLDDSKAPVFAREFYKELLAAKLKVCTAVSKARLKLYNDHDSGDPIWASPVLIAQPMDWMEVEGVLRLAMPVRPGAVVAA